MAALTPLARQCRHFSTSLQRLRKPNIQRPRVPGIERRILNAVTVPIFPPDQRTPTQKCFDQQQEKMKSLKSEVEEAYNAFRKREAVRLLEHHQMIAICHALPVSDRDFKALQATVYKAGFRLVFIRNDLGLEAIDNTKYANLAPYMTSNTAYVCSTEVKLAKLVKVLRKTPSLALMGGLVEERILSRSAMLQAAKLPPLDTVRGELLTILSATASKTSRLLGRHTQELSANLTQLVTQGSEGEGKGQTEGSSPTDGDGAS